MSDLNWPDLQVEVPQGDPAQTLLDLAFKVTGLDPAAEDTLRSGLNLAGNAVETYLDRVIAKRSVTQQFRHHFGAVILREYPLDGAVPPVVTINGNVSTGYDVYSDGINTFLTRQAMRPDMPADWRAFDNVTVAYDAGYDPLPTDLAYGLVYTSMSALDGYGDGSIPGTTTGEVRKETVQGVGTIEYASVPSTGPVPLSDGWGVVPPTAAQLLSKYKRMVV